MLIKEVRNLNFLVIKGVYTSQRQKHKNTNHHTKSEYVYKISQFDYNYYSEFLQQADPGWAEQWKEPLFHILRDIAEPSGVDPHYTLTRCWLYHKSAKQEYFFSFSFLCARQFAPWHDFLMGNLKPWNDIILWRKAVLLLELMNMRTACLVKLHLLKEIRIDKHFSR